MNMLRVNFPELYQRHLCRHSQYGINVVHLATVIGSYYALFSLAAWLVDVPWVLLAIPVPYVVLLAINLQPRLLAACVVFLALFFLLFFAVPPLWVWLCPVLLVACHVGQNASHKIWDRERDMSAYQQTYRKGPALKLLLAFYELPLLLNYLVFDRQSWGAPVTPTEPAVCPHAPPVP